MNSVMILLGRSTCKDWPVAGGPRIPAFAAVESCTVLHNFTYFRAQIPGILFVETRELVADRYLTLKQAAERLSVHTATVRRWANQGTIASIRTPGGHRRFPELDVERLAAGAGSKSSGTGVMSQGLREAALSVTRQELEAHRDESWISLMDEESREESRLLGRRLMGLLMQFIAADDGQGKEILEEARVIGRIYSKSIMLSGITLPQALKATMFFRDHILESAVMLPNAARLRPEANKKVFRRINEFLNAIQLVVAETYGHVEYPIPIQD